MKVSDKSSAFSSDEQLELEDIVGSGNYYSEELFTVSKVIKQDKNYLYEIEYDGVSHFISNPAIKLEAKWRPTQPIY